MCEDGTRGGGEQGCERSVLCRGARAPCLNRATLLHTRRVVRRGSPNGPSPPSAPHGVRRPALPRPSRALLECDVDDGRAAYTGR